MAMHIGINLRSSVATQPSGVGHYVQSVLGGVLGELPEHQFKLLATRQGLSEDLAQFKFLNTQVVRATWPSRVTNVLWRLTNRPAVERWTGVQDAWWMPNIDVFPLTVKGRLVVTVHDLSPLVNPDWYSWRNQMWHWAINIPKLLQRADEIIAVSDYTARTIVALTGVLASKVKVAHLGIDRNLFTGPVDVDECRRVRNKYTLPSSYWLYMATLECRKNVLGIIAAFNQLPAGRLILAGKLGHGGQAILEAISQSPKRHLISYLGYVPAMDKPALYTMATALVWPSFYEGFGLPLVEAMAVGTPVITSAVTSIPEVVGAAGIYVQPHETDEIAGAMLELETNAKLRQSLIQAGLIQSQKFQDRTMIDTVKAALIQN